MDESVGCGCGCALLIIASAIAFNFSGFLAFLERVIR